MSNISLFDCLKQHFLHLPKTRNAKKEPSALFCSLYFYYEKCIFILAYGGKCDEVDAA